MPRMVQCVKLGKELPGVIYKPFLNDLGTRIYENISQDAWRLWVEQSKMMVNEYRIDLTSAQGQKMLLEQAEKFLFGEGMDKPAEFVAPAAPASSVAPASPAAPASSVAPASSASPGSLTPTPTPEG
jgi:Fe-S cluster biosynthesis and repair protein YggX